VRFHFLTVVFEVLKVVYEVLRFVLEVLTVVNSCGCVSNSCVFGFAYVSVEMLLPSSVCPPHTSNHFESITLTTVKFP
jgi:hypothetical protein